MVERVRIQSNRILLLNENSGVVFDTNNFYLKSDVNGSFKAGGYNAAPSVYGYAADISNKNNGGYCSQIVGGVDLTAQSNYAWRVYIPKSTTIKFVSTDSMPLTSIYVINGIDYIYYSPRSPFYYNKYNYDGSVTQVQLGEYSWKGVLVDTGLTDSDSNMITRYHVTLQFVNMNNQLMTTFPAQSNSGYIDISVNRENAKTWERLAYNSKAGFYNLPFSAAIGGNYNAKAGQVIWSQNILLQNMLFLSENTPQTLSISRTP